MTGRLFLTTKTSAPTTTSTSQCDTKPIRLRRDPLPATTTPLIANNDQTANGKKVNRLLSLKTQTFQNKNKHFLFTDIFGYVYGQYFD